MEREEVEGVGRSFDDVHERVRSMILRGELAPGESASQVWLARRLGVSRTPLREALRMLQREGLIESEPNRRLRVAAFSLPDLEQLYVMRITLEATAARLTIPHLSSEEIASMEGHLAQMAHFFEQEDFERWEVPHRAFHHALVRGAGSRISGTLSQLSDHAERYRRFYMTQRPETFRRAVAREHRLILDAAKSRDAETGARRLAAHLARTVFAVVEIVDGSRGVEALRETLERIVGLEDPWPT
ncbi:MAG: GntR family transcriptional regulator [Rubrobacteraceae bacterium]